MSTAYHGEMLSQRVFRRVPWWGSEGRPPPLRHSADPLPDSLECVSAITFRDHAAARPRKGRTQLGEQSETRTENLSRKRFGTLSSASTRDFK